MDIPKQIKRKRIGNRQSAEFKLKRNIERDQTGRYSDREKSELYLQNERARSKINHFKKKG